MSVVTSIVGPVVGYGGGVDTSSGDAAAYHLKTGKKAWVDGAEITGTGYFPAMMKFNDSTGYYDLTGFTTSGNIVSAVVRFKIATFAGSAVQKSLMQVKGPLGNVRLSLAVRSSDWSTADQQGKLLLFAASSAGVTLCLIFSNASVLDNNWHTLKVEFNATAGTAEFVMDGTAQDDVAVVARVAPTVGTLDSGASSFCALGQTANGVTAGRYWPGEIGYFGYRDVGGLSWSDFMQADGTPKNIESTLNTVWGAQPQFWNESGYMQDNKGSAGAMTANGTIVVAPASSWS